jgi:VanZ family protein
MVRFGQVAYNFLHGAWKGKAQGRTRNEMSAAGSKALPMRPGWLWAIWLVMLSVWTLALVTTYPVQIKQQVLPHEAGFPASKLLHVTAYAFLCGFAAFLPVRGGWRWLPLLVLSLHGFGTEFCQTFVPLRYGSWSDVAIDHTGILLGLLLTLKWWLPGR